MRARRSLPILLVLGALGTGAQLSGAAFQSSSANRANVISAAGDWLAPTVDLADPGPVRGTVTLTATADDGSGSGVSSVRFQRATAGSGTYVDICVDLTVPWSCSWSTAGLADGDFDLRAVATDRDGMTSDDVVADVVVDNTAPSSVEVTDPGSPLFGAVTVAMSAADGGSGIGAVALQRAPAGGTTWTEVCSDTSEPYSCRWDTTAVADGQYDLRAIATDAAGNSRTSAVVGSRRVDNSKPSVTLDDPGAFVRGTTTLTATPVSASGVRSVTFQRAPAGGSTWTTICSPQASPWTCAWNTTTVADGPYDLRAVMVTGTGASVTSATVASRQVDNAVVRGSDVQLTNKVSGTVGRLESGDVLRLTYSKQMRPSTLVPGWDGTASVAVQVRARDGALVGASSTGDTLDVLTNGGAATGLGAVNLRSDKVRSSRTVTFAATAALATTGGVSVVTITLGTTSGNSNLRTAATSVAMTWTPSAVATDLAGAACSTSPVTESGTSDVDG